MALVTVVTVVSVVTVVTAVTVVTVMTVVLIVTKNQFLPENFWHRKKLFSSSHFSTKKYFTKKKSNLNGDETQKFNL